MIYIKDTYKVIKSIRRNARCSSGKSLLLFHYIDMLTYCVVYKHYYVILHRFLDTTIILSMEELSKSYHILFKPAINYNYNADNIKE